MGAISRLADDIWTLDVPLDDYTVRGLLVLSGAHALVWDTLSHPRDMSAWSPLIGTREPLVVYSHADWDHVWGTAGFSRTGAIIGHSLCRARFSDDVPMALREKQLAEPGAWDEVRLIPPGTTFDDGMTVPLGELTLQLSHLPGHTPDSSVGFIPERGLLMMGDAVETPFPVVPSGRPLGRWIAELERWARDARVTTVVPAHGRVGGRDLLASNIEYLSRLRDRRPIEIAGPLTAFYQQTHESNLRACMEQP